MFLLFFFPFSYYFLDVRVLQSWCSIFSFLFFLLISFCFLF
jgi:hypothetical protein